MLPEADRWGPAAPLNAGRECCQNSFICEHSDACDIIGYLVQFVNYYLRRMRIDALRELRAGWQLEDGKCLRTEALFSRIFAYLPHGGNIFMMEAE